MEEPNDIPVEDLDPYRADATDAERADHVAAVLLMDEDPVRRYRTIRLLQGGRLRDVAAVSLRQLRDQHGTTEAAANAVGISRQAANELLDKARAPGARLDRGTRDKPTYQYGAYLAAAQACAAAMPDRPDQLRRKALDRWSALFIHATQTLRVFAAVDDAAQLWLKRIRVYSQPAVADARAQDLGAAAAAIADWITGRKGDPQLTVQEQYEVQIGYHHARVWLQSRSGK